MFWHLYRAERATFYTVLLVAAVLAVELRYLAHDALEAEVVAIGETLKAGNGGTTRRDDPDQADGAAIDAVENHIYPFG